MWLSFGVAPVMSFWIDVLFFFQAEDGIRDLVRSRGLGDVYKRQASFRAIRAARHRGSSRTSRWDRASLSAATATSSPCLLYTSDAADERSSVDLGGRRIIKKKKRNEHQWTDE